MKLTSINNLNDILTPEIPYLDATKLIECAPGNAIAFVTDTYSGMSKTSKGYVTFYLKDIHANVVDARLFDVKDFMLSGVKSAAFKNHLVKLNYVAQEYNGRISLIIDGVQGIELWNGEADISKFIGHIACETEQLLMVGKKIFGKEWILPFEYSHKSLYDIGQGRTGAFLKVMDMVLASLIGIADLDEIDSEELLRVFFIGMEAYFNILLSNQTYDNLGTLTVYDEVQKYNLKFAGNNAKLIILDTIRALSDLSEPLHLYAHLITHSVKEAIFKLNLTFVNTSLILNGKTNYGGAILLKY